MKVGDLVRHKESCAASDAVGLVVGHTEKKVWRSYLQGKKIDWDKVKAEPHVIVLFAHND